MADIYSLHLQWNLGSTFSVTQDQRCALLRVGSQMELVPASLGGNIHSKKEKCSVSHPQGLELRPGLPAVLLLTVTTVNGPKSYRKDSSLQLGQTSQLQALGLGEAEADGHSQARDIVTVRSEGKQGSTAWKLLLASLLIVLKREKQTSQLTHYIHKHTHIIQTYINLRREYTQRTLYGWVK